MTLRPDKDNLWNIRVRSASPRPSVPRRYSSSDSTAESHQQKQQQYDGNGIINNNNDNDNSTDTNIGNTRLERSTLSQQWREHEEMEMNYDEDHMEQEGTPLIGSATSHIRLHEHDTDATHDQQQQQQHMTSSDNNDYHQQQYHQHDSEQPTSPSYQGGATTAEAGYSYEDSDQQQQQQQQQQQKDQPLEEDDLHHHQGQPSYESGHHHEHEEHHHHHEEELRRQQQQQKDEEATHQNPNRKPFTGGEVFIFDYGVVVFWNFRRAEELLMLEDLAEFSVRPFRDNPDEDLQIEEMHFQYDTSQLKPRIFNDMITMKTGNHMIKLTLSHGLSQSAVLARYEDIMDKTIDVRKRKKKTFIE
jgi:uncharacterized Rmd1/YagE family protein